jgi:LuxR family transcriptional regulator, maltose regulon positive regulatory protein
MSVMNTLDPATEPLVSRRGTVREPSSALTHMARPAGLPRVLDVELPRMRLVRLLESRWDRPVTLLVAGPGFGKTTVLAQAVRAHQVAPRGIDVWVSCEAAYEDPVRFAQALLDAISVDEPARRPGGRAAPGARDVVGALIRRAPLEVCLLLDDVHEIPPGSPGAALLREVTRTLPATAHLVLSGREAPDVPLARREATGEVLRFGGEDLAFTDVEVRALARRLGRDARIAEPLHGWPAMVRLSLAAGPGAPWQYAREEVLGRVGDSHRRTLAALAALGTATARELAEVADVAGEPADLDDLARQVPLVGVLEDGRYRAHDLWAEAMPQIMTVQDERSLRERAAAVLIARGDLARAGRLACQAGDWRLLGELAVDLVHTTLSALPQAIAERWLGAVPPPVADDPAFLLLRAAVLHAGNFKDPGIDPLLDQAWQGMLGRRDQRGAAAVLGQAMITAHSRADLARLVVVAEWGDRLDGPVSPAVTLLRRNVAAMRAELAGDPEAALAEFAQAPVQEVSPALALSMWRFHFHCLNMCGRGREAAELADRTLDEAGDEFVRLSGAMARWFDGDPSALGRLRRQGVGALLARAPAGSGTGTQARVRPPETVKETTAREGFVATALAAVMAASCGAGALFPSLPCGDPADYGNPRDATLACAAAAAVAAARGAEPEARQAYARHVARWPVEDRFAERHLRRFLALGYVLSEPLRAHWDSVALGPSHLAARATARVLVRARAGDLTGAGELAPAHALCFLPLPWSAELAARLAAAGHPHGLRLSRWLADTLGPAVRRQLRETAQSADELLAAGSAQLLAALPAPPAHRTQIAAIGPLRLIRDGIPVDAPELRRARVRQLLSVLILRPVLTRDQAIELLWPDLDPEKAARNMRVTLTHLRRLLEPDRSGGEASYHLRTDGDRIRLLESEFLTVDLWTLNTLDKRAGQARAGGDIDRTAALLADAVELWRGEPLPDLHYVCSPDIEVEADQVRARHVGHLLALSELRLVADDAAASFALAERALSLEPFDARGHRVALAAALRGRCPAQIAAAHRRVCLALRQLGVPPDPPTAILLRQAARWASPGTTRARPAMREVVNARLAPPCERRVISIRHDKGAHEMATLELVTLECHRKHDLINKDEPQITVDGITVWNGVMAKGAKADLRPTSVHFNGRAEVTLQEVSNGKPKQIGDEVTVRENGNPASMNFKTSGTWYELVFTVA